MNEVSYTKYIEVYYDMMNRYVFECDKLEIWNRICMKTMSEKFDFFYPIYTKVITELKKLNK